MSHENDPTPSKKKIVSCLGKFLMDCEMDYLVSFLSRIGLRFSIQGNVKTKCDGTFGYHSATIFIQRKSEENNIETVEEYKGNSALSPKAALCGAIAEFLINEEHDYHDYKGLVPDMNFEDKII